MEKLRNWLDSYSVRNSKIRDAIERVKINILATMKSSRYKISNWILTFDGEEVTWVDAKKFRLLTYKKHFSLANYAYWTDWNVVVYDWKIIEWVDWSKFNETDYFQYWTDWTNLVHDWKVVEWVNIDKLKKLQPKASLKKINPEWKYFLSIKKYLNMFLILTFFYRQILKLRYQVNINWVENLDKNKPILFFPNHPWLIDPQILFSFISKYVPMSPVVTEWYFDDPVLWIMFRWIWAVKMNDSKKWNTTKEDIYNILSNITDWLNSWKNVLIYPSWQIYSQWHESIIWKQSAYNIIKILRENKQYTDLYKEIQIMWIRTKWLWWSMWTKSREWVNPNFFKTLFYGIWLLIANLIFFTPRRQVNIDLVNLTDEIKQNAEQKDLNAFNKFLEDFYNQWWEEQIRYLRHYFYRDDVKDRKEPELIEWSHKSLQKKSNYNIDEIDELVKSKIIAKISEMKEINADSINHESNLILDLYFDSLDLAELKSYVQTIFEWASNPPILDLKTVWDMFLMAIWKSDSEEALKDCNWWNVVDERNAVEKIENLYPAIEWKDELYEFFQRNGINILGLLKREFASDRKFPYVYDNIFWLQSRWDFLVKAYLISDYVRKIEWKYVWIMLPSVSSSSILIVATYLAWKIPVMLNWTLWESSFDHCIKFSKTNVILTSANFYEKVQNDWLEKHKWIMMFLEEMLKDISLLKKITALFKSHLFMIPKLEKEAVILFTSWSESLPKAVSLTHLNIIENIRWALQIFRLRKDDILLWFLPPFHSFWFTVNTIMPLITWIRVVYTPDPNDSKTILEIIKHTKVTSITSTPSFLKMIMRQAWDDDLKSLRYVVVWAEKCPDDVFENFERLAWKDSKILEWYWITECSPVISLNPLEKQKKWSVWVSIKWWVIKIISLEDWSEVEVNSQGMIYFKANSVFEWYMDESIEPPFNEIDWESYYKTWDLGYLDEDGYLYITWRLKRFVKIAWEMISLPFIEWILIKKYWTEIAVEALEQNWNAKIVLFATEDIAVEEANDFLRNNWASNLIKISEFQKIDEIPVLWTGKIDYKELKKLIQI